MKQVPALQMYKNLRKDYVQICWQYQEELKNEKENLSGNMIENCSDLGFNVARCSEQPPWPLCLVCSQILSNNAKKPSTLARHFHSKQGLAEGLAGRGDGHGHPKSEMKKIEMLKLDTFSYCKTANTCCMNLIFRSSFCQKYFSLKYYLISLNISHLVVRPGKFMERRSFSLKSSFAI